MSLKTLRILHFNDAYEVDKTPWFLRQWIARRRPDTLATFSGDILNPSFASMFLKGEQFVPFFRRLPLDAAVIGNHEFDHGLPQFLRVNQLAPLPWMVRNYLDKDTGRTVLDLPGTMIKEINGCKVGVVGIVDQAWKETTSIDHTPFKLEDPIESCRAATAELKAQGCDFVVVLTHTELETDIKLLESDLDIDLILGGHNHVYYAHKIGRKLLVKSGCDFKYFTEILLEVGRAIPDPPTLADGIFLDDTTRDQRTLEFVVVKPVNGVATPLHVTFTRHKVDFHGPFDPELKVEVDEICKKLAGNNEMPVAFFEGEMDIRSLVIRASESAMADLATDLVRVLLDVDIVLIPSGHIRTEKKLPAQHVYRLIELLSTFPLQDIFDAVQVTGADLQSVMEEGIQHVPQARGSYPNVSGMRFSFRTKSPPLSRILRDETTVLGKPIDPTRLYSLATIKWIREGGDGYTHMVGLPSFSLSAELCSLDAFKHFLNLPSVVLNRDEFRITKPHLDAFTLDELLTFRRSGDPHAKTIGRVTPKDLEAFQSNFPQLVQRLTAEAAERLLMYRLPHSIVTVEDTHVFTFGNRVDDRVRRLDD